MPLHNTREFPKADPTSQIESEALNDTTATYEFPAESRHDSEAVYRTIHEQLILDGNSQQNLATFCTTWIEPEVKTLMDESADKNMIDKDEYPHTAAIEERCVHMLADLWNSPEAASTIGCSTTGSSEAAMLGGLALKWNWRKRQSAKGKSSATPNLIMGPVQVCWHKFCRYFDVEIREVPMDGDRLLLTPEEVIKRCDENTIGVVVTLGVTFTLQFEPVHEISIALDRLFTETGLDIPIHALITEPAERSWHPLFNWILLVGFSPALRQIDQCVGTQIRARPSGRWLGIVAREAGPSRRTDLRCQLSWRQHAHVRAQLLTPWRRNHLPVLQLSAPRQRGAVARYKWKASRAWPLPRGRDRKIWSIQDHLRWPRRNPWSLLGTQGPRLLTVHSLQFCRSLAGARLAGPRLFHAIQPPRPSDTAHPHSPRLHSKNGPPTSCRDGGRSGIVSSTSTGAAVDCAACSRRINPAQPLRTIGAATTTPLLQEL